MKVLRLVTKIVPFVAIIALTVFAEAGRFRLELIKPFALITGGVLLLNLIIALFLKVKDYFTFGLTGVALTGIISIFIFPVLGQIYTENIIVGLYLGLLIVAVFPPLFRIAPFTVQFSKDKYPEAVTSGQQFLKVNLIINYIWAGLFVLGIVLTLVHYYSDDAINAIIATLVPIFLLLAIGIPVTVKLPGYLMQKVGGEQILFKSIGDMFSAMPYGLNKENARAIDTVVQFYLTGEEVTTGYFIIKDQRCTYNEGENANPKTTIKCDSKLWLQISNNEVSGDKALINGEYEVEGDATLMFKFVVSRC
ncbi:MAG: SCP2 sterol-binding domain-containing protein [Bacteroidales bacterium]|nr:SCP2 sterol-binding domain-containing protein [Bacteroidales bacterium]